MSIYHISAEGYTTFVEAPNVGDAIACALRCCGDELAELDHVVVAAIRMPDDTPMVYTDTDEFAAAVARGRKCIHVGNWPGLCQGQNTP